MYARKKNHPCEVVDIVFGETQITRGEVICYV